MKRSRRLEPVQKLADDAQRAQAAHLATAQQRVTAAETRLAELQRYHTDYANNFQTRAATGVNCGALRDYQVFLARLAEAVRQQQQLVERARGELTQERHNWKQAAVRAKAVGTVIDSWRREENQTQERRDQRDADERSQRKTQPPPDG